MPVTSTGLAKHPHEDVEVALRVLALCGGDARRAHSLLLGRGYEIPRRTLSSWKTDTYAQRYHQVLTETQQEIGSHAADRAMEIAGKANAVEELLVEETELKVHEIEPKDLARSAQAMTQVKAENVRTARLLREQPTSIVEARDPAETIKELQALGIVRRESAITVEVETPPTQPPIDEPVPEEASGKRS